MSKTLVWCGVVSEQTEMAYSVFSLLVSRVDRVFLAGVKMFLGGVVGFCEAKEPQLHSAEERKEQKGKEL